MNRQQFLMRPLVIATSIGVLIGILGILSLEKIDQLTSSDAFCSNTCHVMTDYIANEASYINSPHRTTHTGVQAGCADCHRPKGTYAATWAQFKDSMKYIWSYIAHDLSTLDKWNKKREEMAYRVRDKMLVNNSETCRSCHNQPTLHPESQAGAMQHELAHINNLNCIACHYNLVHRPVAPRMEFLLDAGIRPYINQ